MSYTPAPWRVSDLRCGVFQWDIIGPNGEDIAYANPSDGADEPTLYPVAANAHLIAAAPELYEAARLALTVIDFCLPYITNESDRRVVAEQALRAAIAKAEGR